MSIVTVLDITFIADKAQEALGLFDDILVATRAFEGCEGVDVLVQQDDKTRVLVIERWASIEADTAYRAWRASEGPSPLAAYIAAAPTVRFFDPR